MVQWDGIDTRDWGGGVPYSPIPFQRSGTPKIPVDNC